MRGGDLDRRVRIETKTTARGATGQAVDTWSLLRTVWAKREMGRVFESFTAQQQFATAEAVFRVRYFPSAANMQPDTHRLVDGERTYNILGAVELGRKEGVQIVCIGRGENAP